ncbi:Zn(2)-C6 fungal-type domain-containing protein [Mycena indigotica]|uniref:Zn(2)-C6 fungal-type domain-containing protein n=1 Tax=Mycena indigotica TaxID=2126181 RepID=A0A8H6TI64_9AGAR|nr:Zn(2)-C6 fungal-type domain-containing protein [Mycena indigotica]KAF7316180.1 Zn(2)-C6 fungal-type domain-containing protein [Mycena indigotica]
MPSSNDNLSSKKLPACDSCKAKRVLCHPQPDGQSCPRCVEKQILCKTTYVRRGRPKKAEPSSQLSVTPADPAVALLSNTEVVKHLFKCFTKLAEHCHAMFLDLQFEKVLTAASWRLDLLQPQASALAHCICAVAATMAFHPDILGSDLELPESLADTVFFIPGNDFRAYGARRAHSCRILYERALRVATESCVQAEPSKYNTLSCFLLDSLEDYVESSSRPWAASYVSHYRTFLSALLDTQPDRPLWEGYLLSESLRAVIHRKPVLITLADQLSVSQGPPRTLESLLEASRQEAVSPSLKHRSHFALECIRSFVYYTTKLCRDFYENISGDYARRQPISDVALRDTIETLTSMQALISFCFSDMNFPNQAALQQLTEVSRQTQRPETSHSVRTCAFAMSIMFAAMALTLHTELEKRANENPAYETIAAPPSESTTSNKSIHSHLTQSSWASVRTFFRTHNPTSTHLHSTQSPWTSSRIAFLRSQAHDLVLSALPDLRRVLMLQDFPLHGLSAMWTNIMGWAEFCIEEADRARGLAGLGGTPNARGEVSIEETVSTYEHILHWLKGLGYTHSSARLDTLITRMEAHLTAYRQASQSPPDLGDMSMSMFTEPAGRELFSAADPQIDLEMLARSGTDMSFLLDNWMAIQSGSHAHMNMQM